MIGGSILAGVGLSGAYMFKDQKFAQTRIEHDRILQAAHSSLTKYLQNIGNCNATFNAGVTAITVIKTCTSNCSEGVLASAVSGSTFVSVGSWADSGKIWQITGISLKSPPLTNSGRTLVYVDYQINPALAAKFGSRTARKDIGVNFRFTQTGSPSFMSCLSGSESSVNNLNNDLCLGLAAVNSSGTFSYWDDATQSCILKGTTAAPLTTCSSGNMVVQGFNPDGTIHCRTVNYGYNNSDLIDGTTDACGSGASSTAQFTWDGTKLRIQCN